MSSSQAKRVLAQMERDLAASRAEIAAMPGAEPCPVCGMNTPDVAEYPPCYVPYAGRRADCAVFPLPNGEAP